MPYVIQTNFTSGEVSPRLKGRVDLEQYSAGASTLLNFQVLPAGGITRRGGSHHTGLVKSNTGRVRLVPFVVSTLTAYVLEFGNLYLRVWRNRGQVVDGSNAPVELVTPYLLAELRDIDISQSADVLYLAHGSHAPRMLSRTAANVFSLALVPFVNGPYDTENTGDIGATGAAPVTSNTDAGTATPAPGGTGTPTTTGDNHDGGNSGADPGGSDPGGDGSGGKGGEGSDTGGGAGAS